MRADDTQRREIDWSWLADEGTWLQMRRTVQISSAFVCAGHFTWRCIPENCNLSLHLVAFSAVFNSLATAVDWRMRLQWILGRFSLRVWSGFSWLRIATGGWLFWTRWQTFRFWRHGVSYVCFLTMYRNEQLYFSCDKVFSCYKPRQNAILLQRFRGPSASIISEWCGLSPDKFYRIYSP
jgi:hypothetical protein